MPKEFEALRAVNRMLDPFYSRFEVVANDRKLARMLRNVFRNSLSLRLRTNLETKAGCRWRYGKPVPPERIGDPRKYRLYLGIGNAIDPLKTLVRCESTADLI